MEQDSRRHQSKASQRSNRHRNTKQDEEEKK